jgi:hypothetical protein
MKTYYIYNLATDEYIGQVEATSTTTAELKAIKELNITEISSDMVAAFTERL